MNRKPITSLSLRGSPIILWRIANYYCLWVWMSFNMNLYQYSNMYVICGILISGITSDSNQSLCIWLWIYREKLKIFKLRMFFLLGIMYNYVANFFFICSLWLWTLIIHIKQFIINVVWPVINVMLRLQLWDLVLNLFQHVPFIKQDLHYRRYHLQNKRRMKTATPRRLQIESHLRAKTMKMTIPMN